MVFKVGDAVVSTLTKDNLGAGTVLSVTEDKAFVAFANRKNSMWCYNDILKKYDDWEHDMNQVQQEIDSRVIGYDIPIADLSYDPPTFSEENDAVNNPDHYNNGKVECIDYLKDNLPWEAYTGYLEGNCKKYLHRFRYKKKPLEDLKKARWYLERLISELED
jgi:hypothetical protein